MKKILSVVLAAVFVLSLGGCTDARVASSNLSKAAEMFELERRIVFYDAIQGTYLLSIEGRCSMESHARTLDVTCKVGDDAYKKHRLGLSDNVTYFSEQIKQTSVSVYHYRVIFKPQTLVPNVDLRTSN